MLLDGFGYEVKGLHEKTPCQPSAAVSGLRRANVLRQLGNAYIPQLRALGFHAISAAAACICGEAISAAAVCICGEGEIDLVACCMHSMMARPPRRRSRPPRRRSRPPGRPQLRGSPGRPPGRPPQEWFLPENSPHLALVKEICPPLGQHLGKQLPDAHASVPRMFAVFPNPAFAAAFVHGSCVFGFAP